MSDLELLAKVALAVVVLVAVCVTVNRLTERGYMLSVRSESVQLEMRPGVPGESGERPGNRLARAGPPPNWVSAGRQPGTSSERP